MATLHLMIGLPGSGKTTEAMRLEKEYHALRLTPDEWHLHLFGNDFTDSGENTEHDIRHTKIEELMWETAEKLLVLGVDVILDFGCWAKEERDEFRRKAHKAGADFKLHYMECSKEELWKRLKERNKRVGVDSVFSITRENLEEWSEIFQPPTKEELEE
ncbi:MAG: ATP-binding protein [Clostridiales bacterium]|nr:ATP-binding protein [Clostridiales bacterium]